MLILFALYTAVTVACATTVYLVLSGRKKGGSGETVEQASLREILLATPEWMQLSGQELASRIKTGELSSEEVVGAYIEQIEKVNPYLNAVCGTRYEAALEEARFMDSKRSKMPRRLLNDLPFYGVPVITKECYEVPGLPYTAGIYARKGMEGKGFCPAMRRMVHNGGAIIVVSGNVSEACMWYESDNKVYGLSRNPYDLTRTVGGSSGGNGALLAAVCAPIAVTSDVGGSTRIPCLFNGLFGHKPTGGTIPNWRTKPSVHGQTERYCQLGPSCRFATDLFPMLAVMAGEVTEEDEKLTEDIRVQNTFMRPFVCPEPSRVDIRKVKVLVMWEQPGSTWPFVSRRSNHMVAAQDAAVVALQNLGCETEVVNFEGFSKSFDIWAQLLTEAQEHEFHHILNDGQLANSAYYEFAKWLLSGGLASNHTLPAVGLAVFDKLLTSLQPQSVVDQTLDLAERFRDEVYAALEGDTILVMPSLPVEAPKHGPFPIIFRFADVGATSILNVLELPATAVPMGLNSDGLPTGIQVVGGLGKDHLTIAAAIALEKEGVAKWSLPKKEA